MNKHFEALELPKILEMLAGHTACADARAAALAITPQTDFYEAQRLLEETKTAHGLIAQFGAPSFGGLQNVDGPLRRAEAGATLSMRALLDIGAVLRAVRGIADWRGKSAGVRGALDDRFSSLYPNKYLEDRIFGAIVTEEEMSDNASPALRDIRRKIKAQEARVREQLERLVRSPAYKNSLQDAIVTQRGGRFVVPVKAEHRAEIPGLVHDTSSSGSTVFIEPAAVVEANNAVKVLESLERDEIERILAELSAEAAGFAESIRQSCQSAVELNLIFAKANLAYAMHASPPVLNADGVIELKQARHPLIPADRVVPVDIRLGRDFDALVITGPNTGGKTVSIKTLGLLTGMAACGLFIPAAENSRVAVFDRVLADIGDEQSIEQSLSTFSAHMTNLVRIYGETGPNTLVLIDELGAGTDPVEGAALAVAILEALRKKGARLAATTHYSELKAYALHTDRVENASCEFSVETLSPTYRLLIGVPGRSNAFAISERLGLPRAILEEARAMVSAEDRRFEDVVDTLEASRTALEHEREAVQKREAEVEALRAKVQTAQQNAEEKSRQTLERARREAAAVTEQARRAANGLLMEIDRLKKEQAKEKDAAALARKARAAMRAKLGELDDLTAETLGVEKDGEYTLPRALQAGDTVLLTTLGVQATVLAVLPGGGVELQAGAMKLKADVGDLRLLKGRPKTQQPPRRPVSEGSRAAAADTAMRVDLRGKNAEEALLDLDMFLDRAVRTGLETVTIVHGKGTGVLRKAVQAHLRRHPNVRSFRLGVYGEGEDGVTIAELK